MLNPRNLTIGTIANGATAIVADVTTLGSAVPVKVVLTADYTLENPPGWAQRPSLDGAEQAYPPPTAPTLTITNGGSLSARTYYLRTSLVSPLGESKLSPEASISIGASHLAQAMPPLDVRNASGWNVYAGTSSGAETRQNAAPLAFGAPWTEPNTGLINGASPSDQTANTILSGTTIAVLQAEADALIAAGAAVAA